MSNFRFLPAAFLIFLTLIFLGGCTSAPESISKPVNTTKPVTISKPVEKKPQVDAGNIDPSVLFMLLTAEIAGQRGQYDIAMEGYLEAAKRVHDPRLTERAAMIAMYMKDGNKTDEAVSLWLKQDPSNLSARKIAALSALKSENKEQAVVQLSDLLKRDPAGFEKTLFELAGALQKEDKPRFIYDVLESISVKHSDQASIYLIQSILAADLKENKLAESKIARAIQLQPDWDKALILQAQLAVSNGDFTRAETLLKNASLKCPDNKKFNKMRAQVFIKSAKYEEAGEVFESLIASDSNDYESQFSYGLVNLQLDKDDKAADIFKKLLEQTEWSQQSAFYLGKIEEKHKETDKAILWFDKVTDGPFQFESAVTSIALLSKDGRFVEAEQRLSVMSSKYPKQKLRVALMQAEIYTQQKQYEKAFNYLTDQLKSQSDQEELLYSRALIADKLNRLTVMENDLQKILAKSPDNVEALNALGYSLTDKTTRYKEAETYLLHALRIKPDEAVILDSYGWLKYKMGNLQGALDYLQRAYDKQPENEIAAHLAEIYWVMGKKDAARELILNALENSPDNPYLLGFRNKFLK